ncbi:hypothetical protein BH11ARM2_BH11ARM2_31320 [soil metagenome]
MMTAMERTAAKLAENDPEFAAEHLAAGLMARLVSHRVANGLTQKEVASRMGVNQSRVSQIENLNGKATVLTLARYALAVGAPLELAFGVPDEGAFHRKTKKPTSRRGDRASVAYIASGKTF